MPTRVPPWLTAAFLLALVSCAPAEADATQPSREPATPGLAASPAPIREPGLVQPGRPMHYPRAAHAASLLRSGEVLITGGFGAGDGAYSDTAELFEPASGGFEMTGAMTVARCCHSSTVLEDGRVLIAGGFNGRYLDEAEIYDPSTGRFTATGRLTTPRMDHAAVRLDDGRVLLVGGVGPGWTFLASAELYDPATDSFSATGDMAVARESMTATRLLDGRVLVTGGHRGRHAQIVVYDSAEVYEPTRGVFSPTGSLNVRRHKHDAALLPDGQVLISGGSDENDDRNAYASTEIYDPGDGVFALGPDMPSVRYKHIGTTLALPDGLVLLGGGSQYAALFDPLTGTFAQVPGSMGTAPLSRLFATATLLNDGKALITGGYGLGQSVSDESWLYLP